MNQRSRLSLLVVQILIISLMVALFGRLFYLQIAAGPKYRDAALSIQSRDVINPATRGLIVDSSGVPLALNKVGLAITIDRIVIDKQPDKGVSVMKSLALLLGLNYSDIFKKLVFVVNYQRERKQDVGLDRVTNQFQLLSRQIQMLLYR